MHGSLKGGIIDPLRLAVLLVVSSWAIVFLPNTSFGQETSKTVPQKADVRHVVFSENKQIRDVIGEVLVEASDGGILLLGGDGRLSLVQPEDTKRTASVSEPMAVMTHQAIGAKLLREMPEGFKILTTKHYVICYNTTDAYAQWTGTLFEKLHGRFYNYWKNRDVILTEPRFPLVALVFENKSSYKRYAEPELGKAAEKMIGYYSLLPNRVTTFDLTGIEGMIPQGKQVKKGDLTNWIFSHPNAERLVATILHEAIHQLAYNSGLQVRLAENPLWVSEGLAVYFESPDLNSSSGTGMGLIGKINDFNFEIFKQYLSHRPADSLVTLLRNDKRFKDERTATEAYAECWALNYFLLQTKTKEYTAYLKYLSNLKPFLHEFTETDEKQRISDFQRFFGNNLETFDRDFIRYISRLKK